VQRCWSEDDEPDAIGFRDREVLIWRFSGHGHDRQDGAWYGRSRWVGI
jgi:hypothetical protein